MKKLNKTKKIKKVTESDIFVEYLRRGYDDIMDFPHYLEIRKQDENTKII